MSVDVRTRTDGEPIELEPRSFFEVDLPAALEGTRECCEPGASSLGLEPFSFEIDGESWTLTHRPDAIVVERGTADGAACVRLSAEDLARLVQDQCTPMTFFTSGTLDMPKGRLEHFLDWWLVLRSAIDRRPLHFPGALSLLDPQGKPLDLHRSFRADDSLEEMSEFLREAGFLHIQGVFEGDEMRRISEDMDVAAPTYADGDRQSWWATTADGTRRLVRMQGFDRHSETATSLLDDPRFLRLGKIPGDGHVHMGMVGNRVEALVKPIGVVRGISDVPWHKDCSLGRHSYECCSLTVGVSVTGADATSGQLRVVAGSHRALTRPAHVDPAKHGLPEIDLPTRTGDVTVHLSCALHMSQPPALRERRVLYTGFRLPLRPGTAQAVEAARARVRAARESAPVKVSQAPTVPRA